MILGQSPLKQDAPAKVIGEARYPGDILHNNFLHGKIVFSGQPHARLVTIDTRAAEALPGVIAILTAKDVPNNEYGLILFDQPVLVGPGSNKPQADISLWEADQVALVIAETADVAAEASELIDLIWEERPIIDDVFTAFADQHLLHPDHGSNTIGSYKIRKGDMARGWAEADVIIKGQYKLPYQEHAYLQPEAGISYIDDAGRVTVEVAGQWAYEDQMQIVHALNLPAEKVRVIYPTIGGAFGGREDTSIQIILALGAMRLNEMGIKRPLRIAWSREESILGHHKRHPMFATTRWGATKAGKITAVEATIHLDAGAYNCTSNNVLGNAHLAVAGPYNVPNAHIDSYAVYTNNVPGGAFRGFGSPQGAFVAENQINKLAIKLGMDPVEIRLQNVLRENTPTITQAPLPKGVSLAEVIEQCALKFDWKQTKADTPPPFKSFQSLPPQVNAIKRGKGIACAFKNVGFSFGFPERCEATIELYGQAEIEQVVLRHGGADVGQGSHTAFRQMTAEAVGVSLKKVKIIASDTAESGDSGSASASRLTWMAGNSIRGAAKNALLAWKSEERPAIGYERYTPPSTEMFDPETGACNPNFAYGYVAQAVEVAIDIETGHIFIERVVCANDVGKIINRQLVEGQIEGAVVQAHGYSLTENLQLKEGRILNPRFSTYLIPGILDIPAQVDSVILEIPDPIGPWGARGMAEMPMIPLAPAITAALYDATGVWFDEIPLTPAKVIAKLAG